MSLEGMLSGLDMATSGLAAERKRMTVIAENISKAHVTHVVGADGKIGPYVRKRVHFREALGEAIHGGIYQGLGVAVEGPVEDRSGEFPKVRMEGHRDADEDGFVKHSNVKLVFEMLDMVIARRSYESNLATFRTWQKIASRSLDLLRS